MKIVITTEEFAPSMGYLEFYLAKELTKLGQKVFIFTFGRNSRVTRTNCGEGFEVIRLPHFASINGVHAPKPSGIDYVLKFIKTQKLDVVHCQPLYSPLSLLFISNQRLSRYKIVGSLITGEYSYSSFSQYLIYIFIKLITENYVDSKTASYIAINEGFKEVLLRLFKIQNAKIRLIPLGADSELFKFNNESRITMRNLLGLTAKDFVVVYSGKIIQSKEINLLLEAIAPIIKQNNKVKVLIVGNGDFSYINHLKKISLDLQILDNIIFHDQVHRNKLAEFYSASDVAVWPGSVSISILEAASVSLPVIVKRSIITKYATAYENGFRFTSGDANDLRKYLEILICTSKLRREMGRKSRLLITEKLNWLVIAKQFINEYESR